MANHASAKKAFRQTVKKTMVNKSRMSRIRTFVKKVLAAIETGSTANAVEALRVAQSEVMRGVKCRIIKLNTASRKISRLSHKIKTMTASAA
jgi:small subunit ribosomal protein S20